MSENHKCVKTSGVHAQLQTIVQSSGHWIKLHQPRTNTMYILNQKYAPNNSIQSQLHCLKRSEELMSERERERERYIHPSYISYTCDQRVCAVNCWHIWMQYRTYKLDKYLFEEVRHASFKRARPPEIRPFLHFVYRARLETNKTPTREGRGWTCVC